MKLGWDVEVLFCELKENREGNSMFSHPIATSECLW
jgi:hypothetical protein